MNLIVCVDDRMGMAFNRRRQSKDREVVKRIQMHSQGQRLWMTAYSAAQFDNREGICVSEHFWQETGPDDWCFAETMDPAPYETQIKQIVLYRWNRHYPSDVHCTIPLQQWRKVTMTEFPGFSHEIITEEVYQR